MRLLHYFFAAALRRAVPASDIVSRRRHRDGHTAPERPSCGSRRPPQFDGFVSVGSLRGGAPFAQSGQTSRALSYATPWIGQRITRTSDPLAGCRGAGPGTGPVEEPRGSAAGGVELAAGTDRAVMPSVVTPLSIDPHGSIRLRLPVSGHPDVALRRNGPVAGDPDIGPGRGLPRIGSGHPDVGGARLRRHGLLRGCRRRGRCLHCRGRQVTAAQDQQRHPERSQHGPSLHRHPLRSMLPCASSSSREASVSLGRFADPHIAPPRALRARSRVSLRASGEQGACHGERSNLRAKCAVTARQYSEITDESNATLSFARRPDVHSPRAKLGAPWG